MTDPLHHQTLGHLLGALDDDEQQNADSRLARDEPFRRQWLWWRYRLARLESLRPDFDPPPGLAERTCRFVARFAGISLDSPPAMKRKMTPVTMPPAHVPRFGWPDAVMVALLLAAALTLIPPAIDHSRAQARLSACQNGLRQLGAALDQYSHEHQNPLDRLAEGGRLTPAGASAVGLLCDAQQCPLCPDAWLAVQGVLHGLTHSVAISNEPPGIWPARTSDDQQPIDLPTKEPLLADAPGDDLPTWFLPHGGRGRNGLFEDGRVDLLPRSPSNSSVPIVFVSTGP